MGARDFFVLQITKDKELLISRCSTRLPGKNLSCAGLNIIYCLTWARQSEDEIKRGEVDWGRVKCPMFVSRVAELVPGSLKATLCENYSYSI